MSMNIFRTSIISIGAFGIGIAFERKFHLSADIQKEAAVNTVLPGSGGDVVDSRMKPTLPGVDNQNFNNLTTSHISLISKHGFPSLDSIRSYPNFIVSYDRRNRVANWVLEYVSIDHIASKEYDRKGIDFFEDKSFHQFFRSSNQDYKSSGYDRGHLAAAGNYRSSPQFIKETYVLSNIAPQVGKGFNRDKWNQLEKYCRSKVKEMKSAWICTGPLYLPQRDLSTGRLIVKYEVIGRNHVSVPTHFFKVILYEKQGRYHMESFLMPNEPIDEQKPIHSFRMDPETIERAAGLLFFNQLPRNKMIINPPVNY